MFTSLRKGSLVKRSKRFALLGFNDFISIKKLCFTSIIIKVIENTKLLIDLEKKNKNGKKNPLQVVKIVSSKNHLKREQINKTEKGIIFRKDFLEKL